jgi:quercetin dioxygenase-like cupin family protein
VHAKSFKRNGATMIPLTRRPGGLQAFKQIVPPGWGGNDVEQRVHEGYDWIYVLSGQIRLVLGDNDFVLHEGEVAEFDTRVPHWFGNPGPGAAEMLCLYGPQGERMHVRARSK